MQSLSRDQRTNPRCERLHRIETGYNISAVPVNPNDGDLPFLLRRAATVRGRNPAEHQQIVHQILARESAAVKVKVQTIGVAQSGSRWVDDADVEDVTSAALMRLARFLQSMRGTSVGELRAGVRTCVRYAAIEHVRQDSRHEAVPIDHGHFTDALSPEESQYAEIAELASSSRAEDRIEFKEKAGAIMMLEPRAAEIVKLRGIEGMPSKLVAEQLGLTVANVDQIFNRSLKKLSEFAK
jgi:RNA polymerase sigma factor (sigma-70 family)